MKLLITGSSGFLGKELKKKLIKNYKIFDIGRNKKTNKIYCNLQNKKKVLAVLKSVNPDIIINLAAESNFLKKKISMHNVNTECPAIFANYCKKNNKYLIQASGTLVHQKSKFYSFRSKLKPETYYGKTKLNAEKKIIKSGCRFSIIRFVGIFGYNGPKHLGINNTIKNAIEGKKIKFIGNPSIKRNYIFVGDAVKVIEKCLKNKLQGIFYASGEIQSFAEMFSKINKILGNNDPITFINSNSNDIDQISKTSNNFNHRSFASCIREIKNNYIF